MLPVKIDESEFDSLSKKDSILFFTPFDKSLAPINLPRNVSFNTRALIQKMLDDLGGFGLGESVEKLKEEFH